MGRENSKVRIDTGVEEGSEISMYYDPMISKLITWGKDREHSMRILDRAFDEYVIQGVTHNLGFGKSILANNAFWTGEYSTSFIPDFYPEGFTGDELHQEDFEKVALAAHLIKNKQLKEGGSTNHETTQYVKFTDGDIYQLNEKNANELEVTNLSTNNSKVLNLDSWDISYNSLISLKMSGNESDDLL
jgi:propionyl-CoA carboxylase alpha chain